MFIRRLKPLSSQLFKNPFIYHPLPNPHFTFSYSLLYSSQTQKTPQKSNAISDYFVQELTHLKTPEKIDAVLSFFKGFGFSKMDLQKIVNSKSGPTVLCANVENNLKPKIKIFQDLGFSNDDIVCIVTANPWLLKLSADNRILPSLLVLKNVLGSVDLVAKLLKVDACFIKHDLDKTLIPNIEFLRSCGIHFEQLTRHMVNFPSMFLLRPESLKKFVEKVDEMRFDRESKMYIYAITCISSMSEVEWEKKLELFRSLGFTEDQMFQMFQKAPLAFKLSPGKIKEVMQVISDSRMYGSSDIVQYPGVFGSSVEKRLKPRLQVLEILRNRNLILRPPGFSVLYCITDKEFIKRFVTPYIDELGGTSNSLSDYFVKQHQFSSEVAMKAASSLSHLKTPEKCDAVLSFFKGIGFSNIDLQNVVDSKSGPKVLCASVDNTLKPKIKIFQDLGFSNDDIVCIVTFNPWLLWRSANNRIFPSLLVLKNLLGSIDLVAKLLKINSRFVTYDLDKTLIPNIEYLKSCGIHLEQLTRHIFSQPRLFLLKIDNLKKVVEKVDEMRFSRESKLYLYAITCLSSMNEATFGRKLELFGSLGFTLDQMFQMFQKEPYALKRSQEKIKEVVQVVNGSLMYDSSDIVQHPGVFGKSVERRLKPRLQVLEILGNRNLIPRTPAFSAAYLITDKEFIKRFVTPYLDELGDIHLLSTHNS